MAGIRAWTFILIILAVNDVTLSQSGEEPDTEPEPEPETDETEMDDSCYDREEFCAPKPFPDLPKTVEEFDKACVIIAEYSNCILNLTNACQRANDSQVAMNSIVTDVCAKDTLLYDVISPNVMCIKNSLDYHRYSCPALIREIKAPLVEPWQAVGFEQMSYEEHKRSACLLEAADFACFSADAAKNCGKLVRDAAVGIAKRMGLLGNCQEDGTYEPLKEMMEKLKIREDVKQEIEYILEL